MKNLPLHRQPDPDLVNPFEGAQAAPLTPADLAAMSREELLEAARLAGLAAEFHFAQLERLASDAQRRSELRRLRRSRPDAAP